MCTPSELHRPGSMAHLFALRSSVFNSCSLEMLSGMPETELLLHSSSTRELHPPMPSGSPSKELKDTSRIVSLHDRKSLKALFFGSCKTWSYACMDAYAPILSMLTCGIGVLSGVLFTEGML